MRLDCVDHSVAVADLQPGADPAADVERALTLLTTWGPVAAEAEAERIRASAEPVDTERLADATRNAIVAGTVLDAIRTLASLQLLRAGRTEVTPERGAPSSGVRIRADACEPGRWYRNELGWEMRFLGLDGDESVFEDRRRVRRHVRGDLLVEEL